MNFEIDFNKNMHFNDDEKKNQTNLLNGLNLFSNFV